MQSERGPMRSGSAGDAILPAHAWMLGVLVRSDGLLSASPAAAGPHVGLRWSDVVAAGRPSCTCPDFCELDHEFE